ncbi:MAG TPA: transcription termination/antitermination protein NusA, partial [bacterium]|nr:transcription termination/antitermination protein NusA [bacterium]
MATTEFKAALIQVATERGISAEDVIESIKSALISAYKKDYGADLTEEQIEEITVIVDPDTGEAKIIKDKKDVTPPGFGRIAAQTAKQVILQKIRESEKKVLFDEFKDKIGILITGQIFRIENGLIILDIGKAQGVLPQSEQVENEHYRINQRLKVYVKDVRTGPRGTEVILSRSDAELVRRLFEQEVPEVSSGVVEIKAIAREAGSRTKIAVSSNDAKIDPVGSCVGQKGVR